jgi:phosphatidate cytidylyltransferase
VSRLLLTRILTAAVLLAAFLAANFVLGRSQFAAIVTIVVALAAYEWGRLCRLASAIAMLYAALLGATLAALALALLPIAALDPIVVGIFALAGLFWMLAVPIWLWQGVAGRVPGVLPIAGAVVLVPAGLASISLQPWTLLAVLVLVWLADTAAYFTGRAFGRRKLAPSISPGKTWAGVGGALLATLAYAIICAISIPALAERVTGITWVPYIAGAGLLCFVSVVGDLFESALKRHAEVKDSGNLLPGHGGILDRIDSATATLPVGALLLHWIIAK